VFRTNYEPKATELVLAFQAETDVDEQKALQWALVLHLEQLIKAYAQKYIVNEYMNEQTKQDARSYIEDAFWFVAGRHLLCTDEKYQRSGEFQPLIWKYRQDYISDGRFTESTFTGFLKHRLIFEFRHYYERNVPDSEKLAQSLDALRENEDGGMYKSKESAVSRASLQAHDEAELLMQQQTDRKTLIPLIENECKTFLRYVNDIDKDADFKENDRKKNERKLLVYHLWFYTSEIKRDVNDGDLEGGRYNHAGNYVVFGDAETERVTRVLRKAFREKVEKSKSFILSDVCSAQERDYVKVFSIEGINKSAGGFMYGLALRIKQKHIENIPLLPPNAVIKHTAEEWVGTIAKFVRTEHTDFRRRLHAIRREVYNGIR